MSNAMYSFALRMGDTSLILSHRLCQMSSKAPLLEEDLALSNLALDHHGLAENWLGYASDLTQDYKDADALAYRRPEGQFHNMLLTEQPNTDFAHVITRQYLLDVYLYHLYTALSQSADERVRGIAQKAVKEIRYHRAHSEHWVKVLAQGGQESKARMTTALDALWKYLWEMFDMDQNYECLQSMGILPEMATIKEQALAEIRGTFEAVGLVVPQGTQYRLPDALSGLHTEHLGHLLAQMQYLPRAYPSATW